MSQTDKSLWPFPGKVLIVDDEYSSVEDAIRQLLLSGVPVAFWDSTSRRSFVNIRAVILDIDLAHMGSKTGDATYYYAAVVALQQIPGTPIVVILSSDYDPEDAKKLAEAYQTYAKKPFPGMISNEGMTKGELSDDNALLGKIKKTIGVDKFAELLLLWELTVDNAKDRTIDELFRNETAVAMKSLIRMLKDQSGENSVGREFMLMALRILARYVSEDKNFQDLSSKLKEICDLSDEKPEELAAEPLFSRIMYFHPQNERLWTGDIYDTGKENEYAIVLTPACDFANTKVQRVMICRGAGVSSELLDSLDHSLYKKDPALLAIANNVELTPEKRKEKLIQTAKERYVESGKHKLPERFYLLRHLMHPRRDKPVILCVDFQEMYSVSSFDLDKGKIEGMERISRLDTPYMDVLLQAFGSYLSRIGVPAVNTPV